ncbi:MAG: ABC transporter permease [Bacteroidaceae bacterium]|nr:ABC transporter permease [Bacteroidaceae bacterium]
MSHLYNNQSQSPLHSTPLHTGRGWGWVRGGFLSHTLKISLRNLLKYKVQNAISIACLAVGVVCFAITVLFVSNYARNIYFNVFDHGIATFYCYDVPSSKWREAQKQGKVEHASLDAKFFNGMIEMGLPAFKEYHGCRPYIGKAFSFDDGTEQPKLCYASLKYTSPNYLHYLWYRSAITGKRIPELQEGDVLISDVLSEKLFGKGTDPRGFTLLDEIEGSQHTIRDVVNVTERVENSENNAIYYIKKNITEGEWAQPVGTFRIEIAEGYTKDELLKQLVAAFPEYTISMPDLSLSLNQRIVNIGMILVVLILGGSVLTIGLMGFMKMELQIFSLRAREMALRRTMGAKPRHLFMLLGIEVLIVFALTALCAVTLTSFLAEYAIPIVRNLNKDMLFDVALIMRIELWLAVITFVLAMLMAYVSVHRQLHAPVGLRVGRSQSVNTKGQSFMLGTQFVVSMILTYAVLGAFLAFSIIEKDENGGIKDNPSIYKDVIKAPLSLVHITPDFVQELSLNPDVEDVAFCIFNTCQTDGTNRDETLVRNYANVMLTEDIVISYGYSYLASGENLIDQLQIEVTPNLPSDTAVHKDYTAIYARTEQAERLRRKWNLDVSRDAVTRPLYQQRSYTLIGYAPCLKGYRSKFLATPSYWMLDEEVDWKDFTEGRERSDFGCEIFYYIFPKDGKYNKVKDAITEIFREAQPGYMNEPPIQDLYEEWFKSVRMIEMMRQLCLILVIVSILCIVASVYSAIALESRGRQKEVALRKIHGAHTRDIILLFGKYYLRLLAISAVIVSVISSAVITVVHVYNPDSGIKNDLPWLILYLILAILIVVAVTLLTISHKIWKVSKIQPAEVVKKE